MNPTTYTLPTRPRPRSHSHTRPAQYPPPNQFGLPDKFTRWRPQQWAAVERAVDAEERFVCMAMPTGSGKSLVYMTIAAVHGGRTIILTSTKALQAQLMADFEEMGLVEVRGKNSYPCKAIEPGEELEHAAPDKEARAKAGKGEVVGCDEGPCNFGVKCGLKGGGCGYFDAVRAATSGQLVIANYAYMLAASNYGQGLGDFDLMILDEAHDAPDAVSGFLTIEIEEWEVQVLLSSRLMRPGTPMDQWQAWAQLHVGRLEEKVARAVTRARELVEAGLSAPRDLLTEIKRGKALLGKLGKLAGAKADWVIVHNGKSAKFSPVWPGPYTEDVLFRGVPKVVMVSATVRPKTAHYLGIKEEDMLFEDYPSSFDLSRRPVLQVSTIKLNRNTSDSELRILFSRVDQIVGAMEGKKGIIHTVSYARQRLLTLNCEEASRFITHGSDGTRAAVARFKASPKGQGMVLVSPSVTTGYDFPYEQCEWQIVLKVPFPDSSDELTRARSAQDKQYPMHLAMQELIQMVGRGMRAADDRCVTFVLDDNLGWFIRANKDLAPRWFLDSIRWGAGVPRGEVK